MFTLVNHMTGYFAWLWLVNIGHMTYDDLSAPCPSTIFVPWCVFWVECLVLFPGCWSALLEWLLLFVVSLTLCDSDHFKMGRHCVLNNNLAFHTLCMMEISLANRMSRRLARHISPIWTFLDFPFKVLSSIALWVIKSYYLKSVFSFGVPGGQHMSLNTHTHTQDLLF